MQSAACKCAHFFLTFFCLQRCLGKITCTIPLVRDAFVERNKDTCSDTFKALAVQVKCGAAKL